MSKEIIISYCWEDDSVANKIDDFFEKRNLVIKRDIRDLKYGTSIEDFAKKMRQGDYIICVISDTYLKRINCMYEIVQIRKEDNFIKDKFCPILVDTSPALVELTPEGIEKYASYWQNQINKQNELINGIADNLDKKEHIEYLEKLLEIYRVIRRILSDLRDNTYVSTSKIKREGEKALERLFEKIRLDEMLEEKTSTLNKEKNISLFRERDLFKTGKNYMYVRGTEKAYLQAFIPAHYNEKLCCQLDTLQMSKNTSIYTLNEKDILEYLFYENGELNDLCKRKWCSQYADGSWWIILPNYRAKVSFEEVYDLATLIDDLHIEYEKALKKIKHILGIEGFVYQRVNEVRILKLEKRYWEIIFNFMQQHTCACELSEWNIFNVNLQIDRVQIIRNDHDEHRGDVSEGVHAQLKIKEEKYNPNVVEIFWEPGFVFFEDEMKYFDNDILWKADYTYEWLVNKLLPKVLFEELPLHKKISFGSYTNRKIKEKCSELILH